MYSVNRLLLLWQSLCKHLSVGPDKKDFVNCNLVFCLSLMILWGAFSARSDVLAQFNRRVVVF